MFVVPTIQLFFVIARRFRGDDDDAADDDNDCTDFSLSLSRCRLFCWDDESDSLKDDLRRRRGISSGVVCAARVGLQVMCHAASATSVL